MKQHIPRIVIIMMTLTFVLGLGSSIATAGDNSPEALKAEAVKIDKKKKRIAFIEAVEAFASAGSLKSYFEEAYGCALIPTVGKGGIGIGGAHGSGYVFKEGEMAGTTSMSQLTVGFQWGGQAYSQIIFFENEFAYEKFTLGNFEFGAQASAVAIKTGAAAQTSTGGGGSGSAGKKQSDSVYDGGMAIFTVAKGGLMYEASVGGQKFKFKPLK